MRRLCLAAALVSALSLACTRAGAGETTVAGPRWTAADSAALDAQVAALEERLLAHRARVGFWQEMRERHQQVTAVACQILGEHALALGAASSRHQARAVEQRKRRLASAAPLLRQVSAP